MKKLSAQTRDSEHRRRSVACSRRQKSRPQEEGYVLLTLLLVVALMAIFALGVIIPIKFENQRDQEQEMIHRGVQYSRAIRSYYKKFGRYPTKLEDLDNTNNLRYLRKHYKDPLNCKNGKCEDFRLLHYGEQGVTLGGGFSIGGGSIPGATPAGSPSGLNGSASSSSGFGSGFGGSSGFGSSGPGNSGVNSNGVFSQSSGFGGSSSSGFGTNSSNPSGATGTNANQSAVPDGSQTTSTSDDAGSAKISANGASDGSSSSTQLVSGGPIVGVASISKKTTIREFNHKKKYNEWQFVYDPALDRGGLITTPYQPGLAQGAATQPNLNGQPPGSTTGSSFGNSSGSSFGQSSNFGNNANPGGSSPPQQPPVNPPQQQ